MLEYRAIMTSGREPNLLLSNGSHPSVDDETSDEMGLQDNPLGKIVHFQPQRIARPTDIDEPKSHCGAPVYLYAAQ